jgi:uncharacterized protein
MADVRSPAVVVHSLLRGIGNGPDPDLAMLYAEDAVVELPFAGIAGKRLEGRDALRAHFAAASTAPFRLTPVNVRLHQTTDDELVVAEYEYEVVVPSSDETWLLANVQIVRVRAGLISHSRDFHDHTSLASIANRGAGA